MIWQEVCEHKSLQNLPFKIELNKEGQIMMSPVQVYHSAFQGKIGSVLDRLTNGHILTECAIKTHQGTKVADVAWASNKRFETILYESECSVAPEICIEILSASNTVKEIEVKKKLYFKNGCEEVWLCYKDGKMKFYNFKGEIEKSARVPEFPVHVDLFA